MKTKDLANAYGLDLQLLEHWLPYTQFPVKTGMGGMSVDDTADLNALVASFREWAANVNAQRAEQAQAASLAAEEKRRALASMIVHSGFTFEGYTITKYSGYISGDSVVQVPRGTAGMFSNPENVGFHLTKQLVHIRRGAITQLKEAAWELGCNAVVGVDFDYIALEPETARSGGGVMYLPYVFAVTAHGSGVLIEKKDRTALGGA